MTCAGTLRGMQSGADFVTTKCSNSSFGQ